MPDVSTDTYGSSIELPSGAHVRLALSSDVPIVNSLVNLTGKDVLVVTPMGAVRLEAKCEPLRVTYARQPRIAGMIADTSDHGALAKSLIVSSMEATPPPTQVTATVHVFAPPKVEAFVRPLPDIGSCCGVLVTQEVADALVHLGSPYDDDDDNDDDDEDEDEEEEKKKPPPKRTRRRERVPVYVGNATDRLDEMSFTSLVRYGIGL